MDDVRDRANCIRHFTCQHSIIPRNKESRGVTWIEILVYPFLLLICALLEHIDLPGFLIFLGLVCIVFGSCMVMGVNIL